MSILYEFQKLYKGDPSETMAICEKVAKKLNMDTETVADFVYLNRYVDSDSAVMDGYEDVDPDDDELEEN